MVFLFIRSVFCLLLFFFSSSTYKLISECFCLHYMGQDFLNINVSLEKKTKMVFVMVYKRNIFIECQRECFTFLIIIIIVFHFQRAPNGSNCWLAAGRIIPPTGPDPPIAVIMGCWLGIIGLIPDAIMGFMGWAAL